MFSLTKKERVGILVS